MKAKTIAAAVLACFGLLVFPLAVAAHRHLYADGAFFLAQLLETGRVSVAGHNPFRFFHHVLTQSAAALAIRSGACSPAAVSRIYGSALFYLPLLPYAAAGALLARKGLAGHLLLLCVMYCLLAALNSFFIISESHLAAALFVLATTIIYTADLKRLGPLAALTAIGTVGFSCYECWAVYFPVCLALFVTRTWRNGAAFSRKLIYAFFSLLCLAGGAFNAAGIVLARHRGRGGAVRYVWQHEAIWSLFSSHFMTVWLIITAVCVLFAGCVLLVCLAGRQSRAVAALNRLAERGAGEVVVFLTALLAAAAAAAIYLTGFPRPQNAYALRLLNLFLPLLYAAAFPLSRLRARTSAEADVARQPNPPAAQGAAAESIAAFAAFAMLFIAAQSQFHNTLRWREFTGAFLNALERHEGFIEVNEVELPQSELLWGWTSPTMSILLQGLAAKPVKSVFFNPEAVAWEPYGPRSREGALLAQRMGVEFRVKPMPWRRLRSDKW